MYALTWPDDRFDASEEPGVFTVNPCGSPPDLVHMSH